MNRTTLWVINVFCFLITIDIFSDTMISWENFFYVENPNTWYYFIDEHNDYVKNTSTGSFIKSFVNIEIQKSVTRVSTQYSTLPTITPSSVYYTYGADSIPWLDQDALLITTNATQKSTPIGISNSITWINNTKYNIANTQFYKNLSETGFNASLTDFIAFQMLLSQLKIRDNSDVFYTYIGTLTDFQNFTTITNGYHFDLNTSTAATVSTSSTALPAYQFSSANSLKTAKSKISITPFLAISIDVYTSGTDQGTMTLSATVIESKSEQANVPKRGS